MLKLLKIIPTLISLQTSRTSGSYYSQACAPETCQNCLAWQDMERLVHLKELHRQNSCWECSNTGRKELLLSIYTFSGRWHSIAVNFYHYSWPFDSIEPHKRGRSSEEIQFIPPNCRCIPQEHLMCLSCANVYRYLLTFKKPRSIVLSFRRWALQENTDQIQKELNIFLFQEDTTNINQNYFFPLLSKPQYEDLQSSVIKILLYIAMAASKFWALCRPCRWRRCLRASKVNNKADLQILSGRVNTRKTDAIINNDAGISACHKGK